MSQGESLAPMGARGLQPRPAAALEEIAVEYHLGLAVHPALPRCRRCGQPGGDMTPAAMHLDAGLCLDRALGALSEARYVLRLLIGPIREIDPDESWEVSVPTAHLVRDIRKAFDFFAAYGVH
jgi:hypothetical protein